MTYKGLNLNQEKIVNTYIQRDNVHQGLKEIYNTTVIPKFNEPVEVYSGVGVTWGNINQVLEAHNKEMDQQANKHFQKYKGKIFKNADDRQDWLNKRKQNKEIYALLIKKIDDHESKDK